MVRRVPWLALGSTRPWFRRQERRHLSPHACITTQWRIAHLRASSSTCTSPGYIYSTPSSPVTVRTFAIVVRTNRGYLRELTANQNAGGSGKLRSSMTSASTAIQPGSSPPASTAAASVRRSSRQVYQATTVCGMPSTAVRAAPPNTGPCEGSWSFGCRRYGSTPPARPGVPAYADAATSPVPRREDPASGGAVGGHEPGRHRLAGTAGVPSCGGGVAAARVRAKATLSSSPPVISTSQVISSEMTSNR